MGRFKHIKEYGLYGGSAYVCSRNNRTEQYGSYHEVAKKEILKCLALHLAPSPRIRVPSLKRNKYTWINFYKMFPGIYEKARKTGNWTYRNYKLKKIKL